MTLTAADDLNYQNTILQHVSRTFALTIPALPPGLRDAVGNAYLLCRIADTIEDDPGLTTEEQRAHVEQFIQIVEGEIPAETLANMLAPRLSPEMSRAERELIANMPAVIRITYGFNNAQRSALARCIRIMARGMARYQEQETLAGLADMPAMDEYCYYVAGVVGEMLTELFCEHSPEIKSKRDVLMPLAVSFGQALQMTNILKDIWEDRQRGACWLPQSIFAKHGVDLARLQPGTAGFTDGLGELIGIARTHVENALRYTLMIPSYEQGIRKFCLWALGMAVLTLRKINAHRDFSSGAEVKISRSSVKATVAVSNALLSFDSLLKVLMYFFARDLPEKPAQTMIFTPSPSGRGQG